MRRPFPIMKLRTRWVIFLLALTLMFHFLHREGLVN